ncbi:Arylsulfatase [Pontiella desulfatans]|uniref:Arylsulfatase n=1 Tax=Pontiella desulfatans TaxID=2750659 RepID=A0A6C2TYC0_PONDE|nr:sulfatase [Pontiella desulfatans]SPS73657.1 sulfatase S1_11 [Kiritimatiellales bacterium]VGO12351.1 Arylsulfatase [Pontiella desulfatans]
MSKKSNGIAIILVMAFATAAMAAEKPNILFIFSDDHAVKSISAYGLNEITQLAPTPNIDRIAEGGALFENNFCANSICAPSRACVLTGKHSHINGQRGNRDTFDGTQQTFPKLLQQAGYSTAIFGKWHLKSDPTGFNQWNVLEGQGTYYAPDFLTANGTQETTGYSTEIVTDLAMDYLKKNKDSDKPFMVMCQYKAPHRNWMPAPAYLNKFDDVTFPEPDTLFDDYTGRTRSASEHKMGIDEHMSMFYDLKVAEQPGRYNKAMTLFMKRMTPEERTAWDAAYDPKNKKFIESNLSGKALVRWKYQRYIKDYLRCVAAVDDNIGRLLDYLKKNGLEENTIVVYSSDQGFYLGEHGWFDKRWMYEESLRQPLAMRWPGVINPGTRIRQLTQNIDIAPTFIEAAGQKIPEEIQGESLLPLFQESSPQWRDAIYYQYYDGGGHGVARHYGVRDDRYKLIHLYDTDDWELFDLQNDPNEMNSEYNNPEYSMTVERMKKKLAALQTQYKTPPPEEGK